MTRKLNFTIADGPIYWRTHRIMELCDYLTGQGARAHVRPRRQAMGPPFHGLLYFDNACDPLEPTGTIRFTVPPMFAGQVGELEWSILQELCRLKIKTAPFAYEKDPALGKVKSILIHVTENPTALMAPPDVNMSQMRGCLVLRDLLGYQKVNGRYEFAAEDLLKRASSVTEDKIATCTASPVKVAEEVRRTPSMVSMKAIRRCLDELKQFGLWAKSHNYQRLAAV